MTRNYLISGVNTSIDIGESYTSLCRNSPVLGIPECKLNFGFYFFKNPVLFMYRNQSVSFSGAI